MEMDANIQVKQTKEKILSQNLTLLPKYVVIALSVNGLRRNHSLGKSPKKWTKLLFLSVRSIRQIHHLLSENIRA